MVLLTFPWLLKNTQQLNTSICIVLEDTCTTPAVLEGAWTGCHTGGCSEYPSGAGGCSDWPLHLCMPAASNPWALKHTQNRILYITWKVSSSGCNTHERNNPMGWRIFLSGAHTKEYLPLCPPSTAPQSHFKQGMRSSKITVSIARLHSNPVNNDMSGLSQLSASISLVHAEQDQPSPRATWVLAPTDTHGCLHMPR